MTTFAVTDPAHTIAALNYALSNLGTGNVTGNVTLPGNVLVANTTTGVVSQYGNAAVFGYLYQWVNLRYSNNSTGAGNSFSPYPTNANYYGVFNSVSSAPSANPTDYQWYQVAGGFGTSRILYYSAIGGRQVQWAAANSAPSSNYLPSVANVAIDLDVVTTAAGLPGERGPIAMAYVITTADPNTATASQLTAWFGAPRDATSPPIGTGLTPPVVGDTAQFTYVNGTTNPSVCYTYNGSIWVPVTAQVISGNVIVGGTLAANAIIAGTITATQIAADTITGNNIAGNTITSINIQTGTITANNIAGNTITGNNIAAGTITTNNFTANTIQGNIIAAGTITAEQLAANAITANTVISSGAVLGSNASLGFWLDGTTGNARFGNAINIGSQLTVGTNANIGTNLTIGNAAIVGSNLTIGNNANIGNQLTVGNAAIVGSNLTVGNNANIGNQLTVGSNATIGTNLTIGNSATIGNTANIGNQLTVGNTANIGNQLTVGSNATIGINLTIGNSASIGNSVSIKNNLTVGNNANIGTNLTISNSATIGNQLTVGSNATIGTNLTIGNSATIGNSVSIGNQLTVGSNATIGTNLTIGNSATIGNSVSIGNQLTVGSNATISGNLIIGTNANIGANLRIGVGANIGTNLIVGNNASIGGNLAVTGLVTSGALNANTVGTVTILTGGVSQGLVSITTGPTYLNNTLPRNTDVYSNSSGSLSQVAGQTGLFVYPATTFSLSGNIVSPGSGSAYAYTVLFLTLYEGSNVLASQGTNLYIPTNYPSNWELTVTPKWISFYVPSYTGTNIRIAAYWNTYGTLSNLVYCQTASFTSTNLVLQSLKR
jgi:UDP-3-O-[3-hydroxymyristoyl] glucosamine N-acyltransferase